MSNLDLSGYMPPDGELDRLDEDNLRRHWRSMGLVAAWRATIRCWIADIMLLCAMSLLRPHTSRRFHCAWNEMADQLSADKEQAQAGLEEAQDIARKAEDRARWNRM